MFDMLFGLNTLAPLSPKLVEGEGLGWADGTLQGSQEFNTRVYEETLPPCGEVGCGSSRVGQYATHKRPQFANHIALSGRYRVRLSEGRVKPMLATLA